MPTPPELSSVATALDELTTRVADDRRAAARQAQPTTSPPTSYEVERALRRGAASPGHDAAERSSVGNHAP